MFMGSIGQHVPHRHFNGRIHTEIVSKTRVMQKITAHTNFCKDVLINNEMKNGNWHTLVTDSDIYIIEIRY